MLPRIPTSVSVNLLLLYARNVKWLMALQFEAVAEAVLETTQCVMKIFVS